MAITQVGATVSDALGSGADVTLTLPSMLAGDVVVLIGGTSNATSGPLPSTAGPSTAGYTQIILDHTDADTATPSEDWCMFGAWYKVMGATPDTSVVGQGNGNASNATVYHAIVLRGVDTTTPVEAVSTMSRPGDSNPPNPPAVTVATVGAWVFACGAVPNLDATATAPTGYAGLAWAAGNDTNDISAGFAYKEATTTGSEDPGAFSGLDAPIELNPGAFTFAIKPAGGGGAVSLTPADSAHAHATESPVVTQVHVLVAVDSVHAHAADAATLTQVHALAPADSLHGHTADAPALAQVHILAPADSTHAHGTESPTLTGGVTLLPADSAHGHTADTPALTQTHVLEPDDTAHGHATEAPPLTQVHVLTPADALHAHAADEPSIVVPSGIPPPAERTILAPPETRTLVVPAEDRTMHVPAESRTFTA